jgi:DNA-binding MurR/RpiR family transcriptional regulator
LQQLISNRSESLPKRLLQVAGYALNNPDEIAFGTAASIAAAAAVQPSTLVRFAQSLGFEGFSDLQGVFRSRLRERVLSYDERLSHLRAEPTAHKASVMFAGFAEAAERSIRELKLALDGEKLEEAVECLAQADTIYLIGLRRSFPITSYMSYAFGKLGVKSQLVGGTGGLAAEAVSFATTRDVVLAISFTPYASETVKLTQGAFARDVPVISVTDSPFSPLVRVSKLWFEVTESHFEGFRSMSATLALAMTMTVAVAERRGTRDME